MECAVLTGDIIKSRLLAGKLKDIHALLREIPVKFNEIYHDSVQTGVSIFRGDSWQILLYKKELAVRLALFIKAYLFAEQNVMTRVSIGIGKVDRIEKSNISESTGAAFELSGKGLDELGKYSDLCIMSDNLSVQYQIKLLDCIFKKITPKQANALRFALIGYKQQIIADNIEQLEGSNTVSQQAVAKLLKNCCWRTISDYLRYYESCY